MLQYCRISLAWEAVNSPMVRDAQPLAPLHVGMLMIARDRIVPRNPAHERRLGREKHHMGTVYSTLA